MFVSSGFNAALALDHRGKNFRAPVYKIMDAFSGSELLTRAIKYFLEGLAVAVAMTIIPKKVPNVEEIATVAVVAAVVFAILDLLSPSIGLTSRQGAGLALGSQLAGGFKMA
jgi:hypothetical protein